MEKGRKAMLKVVKLENGKTVTTIRHYIQEWQCERSITDIRREDEEKSKNKKGKSPKTKNN